MMPASSKRRLTGYIVIGIIMITVMTIIGLSAFMQVRNIVVFGVPENTVDEIIEASGLSIGDNLIFMNTQNISSNIRTAAPFVSVAQVTRVPPDTVKIEITKSEAVASVTFSGEVYVIDSTGRVLDRAEVGSPLQSGININELIEIIGVDVEDTSLGSNLRPVFGTETRFQHMIDILSILEIEGLIHYVSYIDVSNIVNVHFGFMDMYRVILGGGNNLRQTNLRHNIGGLMDYVERVQYNFPNMSGAIDMSDEIRGPLFLSD